MTTGYKIKIGDTLHWRQYQVNGNGGLDIEFQDGTQTAWNLNDSTGQGVQGMTTQGQWVNRSADLSSFANEITHAYYLMTDGSTPPGTWSLYYSDISIVSSDGTVTTIYDRQTNTTPAYYYNYNSVATNLAAVTEISNTGGDALLANLNTTYFLGDHLGSARMELAAGGWPVSSHTYYPFGQEATSATSVNHYKFTGYERDAESGLDYASARQYGSNIGRFISPDPSGLYYADPTHPQSFNLYSYVQNNPLVRSDPSGLSCVTLTDGDGNQIKGDDSDGNGCAAGNIAPNGDDENEQQVNVNANPPSQDPNLFQVGWDLLSSTVPGIYANELNTILYSVLPKSLGGNQLSFAKPAPNILFGTTYCGPGGAGSRSGKINGLCAVHDACFDNAKLNASINIGIFGTGLNPSQVSAAKACNQALYDGARSNPREAGAASLQSWLTQGSKTQPFIGVYLLYPGTEAKPW